MKISKPMIYLYVLLAALGASLLPKLGALYLFVFLVAILIFIVHKKADHKDRRFLIVMVILIFISRFLMSLLVMNARGAELSQDEGLYSKKALIVAYRMEDKVGLERYFFEFFNDDVDMLQKDYGFNAYTSLTAVLYYIFGYQIQAARLINTFCFTTAFLIFFYMAKILFDTRVAKLSSAIFAFFPSMMLWSVAIGVDTIVILSILTYIYSFIKTVRKIQTGWIMLAIVALVVVRSIRSYVFNVLIIATLAAILYIVLSRAAGKSRAVVPTAAVTFVIVLFLGVSLSYRPVVKDRIRQITAKVIKGQSSFVVTDDGGYVVYPERCYRDLSGTVSDFTIAYVRGISYALFSPFPWRIESKLQFLAYPQIILWYFMLSLAPYGFYLASKADRSGNILILVYSFLILSIFALAAGNIGAVFRHRDMVTPFVIIYFSGAAQNLWRPNFKEESVSK